MRQIVLDTETTGLEVLNGHRIIEIGAVEVCNRRLTGRTFHKYVNPERDIDDGAKEVHGITEAFLADKPKFADIWSELDTFLQGAELAAGGFDSLATIEEKSWIAARTDGRDAKFTTSGHGAFWRAATGDPVLAEMLWAALLTVDGAPAAFSFEDRESVG